MKNRRPIPDREFERRFFCEKNQFLPLLALRDAENGIMFVVTF